MITAKLYEDSADSNVIIGRIENDEKTIKAIISTRGQIPSNYGLIIWDGSTLSVL